MTVTTVDRSEQRLVLVLLAVLTVVLAYAMAGAFGATPTSILHWTGVALLVAGIGLAAKGIADLRRQVDAAERAKVMRAEQQWRDTADAGARLSIGYLVVGGLRLQTWGIVCLLAGTILTAFW
jgi:hypothetical protein